MAMSYQNKSNVIITYAGILLILRAIKTSVKRKGRIAYSNGENIFYNFFFEILNAVPPQLYAHLTTFKIGK
jgi:hypothetical protein